jgi:predicted esterase
MDLSAARINRIIQKEIDGGVPSQRIVIAGFSQGGALALHAALRSQHSLGGCVALSTWVPFGKDYPAALSSTAASLKILQVHGDEDEVVSYKWGHQSHELLKTMITPAPKLLTIEGMGHSADRQETMEVARFLRDILQ